MRIRKIQRSHAFTLDRANDDTEASRDVSSLSTELELQVLAASYLITRCVRCVHQTKPRRAARSGGSDMRSKG
jgi:hypothetical protein